MHHHASNRRFRPLSKAQLGQVAGGSNAGANLQATFNQINAAFKPVEAAIEAGTCNNPCVVQAINGINAAGAKIEAAAVQAVNAA